jgi:hypothetical protein
VKRAEAFEPIPKPEPRRKAPSRGVKPVSDKRRLRYAEREHVRLAVLARDRQCIPVLAGAPGRCASPDGGRPELECHEIKTRGRGGSIYSTANCVAVCQRHHDWITGHPGEAHALGSVRHSWEPDLTEPFTPTGGTR